VALGGTAFAANTVATKSKHMDRKANIKLIKKLAPTLSVKHAKTAATATHAGTADSATNATNLGGVAASSYLTNAGSIFISTGTSNWHAFVPTEPIDFTYDIATDVAATAAGTFVVVAHPSLPTELYGKKLELTSATLCYSASANAKITEIEVTRGTFSNGGDPTSFDRVVDDPTVRTGQACVVFPVSGTPLSSLDDIGFFVDVAFKSGGDLELGQSGVTLKPTTSAAS
jgi:hypothetical protein